MTFYPQFVTLGGLLPGNRLYSTDSVITDLAIVDLAANNSSFLGTSGTGSGYTVADIGTPFTVAGGNPTVRAGGIITDVDTHGALRGASFTTIGRYPTNGDLPNLGNNNTAYITGGSGTGGQVIYDVNYTPFLICRNSCGFPQYFKQFTMSMWFQWQESAICQLRYLKGNGSLFGTFWNAMLCGFGEFQANYTPGLINSYTTVSLNSPSNFDEQPTMACHMLFSYDTVSGTAQLYINDEFCTTLITSWLPAPFYGLNPFDGSPNQWRLTGLGDLRYYPPIGMAGFWADPSFLDLNDVSNRRKFINADKTPVDFSQYPTAKIHLYTLPGESPNAFATNRGTGGPWELIGGPLRWQGNTMSVRQAGYNDGQFTTPLNTPVNGSLNGNLRSLTDYSYMNNTARQGATLYYTGITQEPTNGTVSLASDGSFTYTPNPGYSGHDQFAYSVTEAMPAPYQWPDRPAEGLAEITVTSSGGLQNLKLVALFPFESSATYPYSDADGFYGIENTYGFGTTLPQFTLSLWCCQNINLIWEQGLIVMTPSQCIVNLRDVDGNPVFDATFINHGQANKQYLILFSIDTVTQQYSCFGNNVEWPSTDAVFHSSNPIGNIES